MLLFLVNILLAVVSFPEFTRFALYFIILWYEFVPSILAVDQISFNSGIEFMNLANLTVAAKFVEQI